MRYPYDCQPQRRPDNASWVPTTACGNTRVGHLMWGGYASKRIAGPMLFAQLTDEIHLDVQLVGMEACGPGGSPCARRDSLRNTFIFRSNALHIAHSYGPGFPGCSFPLSAPRFS